MLGPSLPGRPRSLVVRGAIALVIVLLAVPLLSPAVPAEGTGSAARVWGYLHIDTALSGPARPFEAFDTLSMNLYDINGDGMPEIVSLNDNNVAYVIDPRTGKILAELQATYPGGTSWGARDLNGIAIGDVNGNGKPDLVIANSAAHLSVWEFEPGQSSAEKFKFTRLWETYVDAKRPHQTPGKPQQYPPPEDYPGLDGNPYIGDVLGDGTQWIFVQSDDTPGNFGFDHNGNLKWMKTWLDGNAGPVVADLDGDGKREVAFASDGGTLLVYDARTGNPKWEFRASRHGANPGSISISPTVEDLDGDGKKEIFVGARHAVNTGEADWMSKQHAWYFLLDHKGQVVWKRQFEWGTPHIYMQGAPVDVNGDGVKDIVAVDWNTIGHKPGNWEKLGGGNLFALDGRTGDAIWHTPIDSTWSNKNLAIADIDGDGKAEILVPTQGIHGDDGIGVYSLDGRQTGWFGITPGWQISRGPLVADLWGDGKLSILLPVYRNGGSHCARTPDVGCREGAIEVYITGSNGKVVYANNDLYNADRPDRAYAHKNPGAKPSGQKAPEPHSFKEWTGNGRDPDGNQGGGDGNGNGDGDGGSGNTLGVPAPGVAFAAAGVAMAALWLRRRRRGPA